MTNYRSNRGNTETTTKEQRLRDQARNALIQWSREAGLENHVAPTPSQQTPSPINSGIAPNNDGGDLNLSVSALLRRRISAQAPDLIEALALGAAGLYMTQTVGQRNLEQIARQWINRLRPSKVVNKTIGQARQVVSIFVVQASGRRPKLVAAKILSDAIEILAELPLDLQVPKGTAWDEMDLKSAFDQLRSSLNDQSHDQQQLLLIDPILRTHLNNVRDMGQAQAILRHTDLNSALYALQNEELDLLRLWLNHPSKTSIQNSPGCRQVMAQLAALQGHWGNHMSESMANVAGVLELSIALGNLQPEHALI